MDEEEGRVRGVAVGGVEEVEVGTWGEVRHDEEEVLNGGDDAN